MITSASIAVLLVTYTPFSFGVLGEVADYPLHKMIRDWNYIAYYYSEERAYWYAEFFINALIVSYMVLGVSLIYRIFFKRKQVVAFGSKEFTVRRRLLTGVVMALLAALFLLWLPSMLKLPNEISGARFGPNGKAVLVNLTFISMHLMSLQFLTLEILAALGFLKGRPKEAGDI